MTCSCFAAVVVVVVSCNAVGLMIDLGKGIEVLRKKKKKEEEEEMTWIAGNEM